MKAAVFHGPDQPLRLEDVTQPEPGPDEILVRVAACGVCHTDLHYIDHGVPAFKKPPMILGHEASGIIAAQGAEVTGFKDGDRVLLPAAFSCGRCAFCRGGRENICQDMVMLGNNVDGAYAEYVKVKAKDAFHLPEEIPLIEGGELAVLARSFTCQDPRDSLPQLEDALHDVRERRPVKRDRVRVLLEGAFCEQPPMELLETLEEAGCAVVEDDLVRGWRWFTEPVPLEGAPLRNLAESYSRCAFPTSVRHDWKKRRDAALVDRVRTSNAQAVVFCIAKFCEPALFDYAPFKDALDAAGIPHLLVEFEEKMWTFERMRNEVETFVESILFD